MPAIYEHAVVVREEDLDRLRHANNQVYLRWMIKAAVAHSRAQGWPMDRYLELGAGWVVRRHEITYLAPALHEDEIIVRTWVSTLERATSKREYRILRPTDGVLLAEAATDWVFVDYSNQKVVRIPDDVAGAFEVLNEEQSKYPNTQLPKYPRKPE